ncbi:MAG TPA: hypothetical protein VIH35_03965 [Kiritimatiellia bacterium]|jgi:hypothetical protein
MKARSVIRRFAVAFAALFGFCWACPSPVPWVAAAAIARWTDTVGADYRLDSYEVDGGMVQFHARSLKCTHFSQGEAPGAEIDFDGTLDGRILNLYPVVAIALLFAAPMDSRRRARAVLAAIALVALVAAVDLYASAQLQHARTLQGMLPQVLPALPVTPGNEAARDALLAWLERVKAMHAFFNAGGRQFLAVLIPVLSGLLFLKNDR